VKKADAVFEGGGVKGLGLVGALTVAEENGYTDWRRVAGTSAGAIVASLLAAGYSAEELKEILMDLEYSELLYYTRPRDVLFHPIGFFSRVFFDYGVNKSSPIRDWLEDRLGARGVESFSDLKLDNSDGSDEYSLRIIASDITKRNMLILPEEIGKYGEDPDGLSVASAVEMSLLFPGFFKPEKLDGSYVIDGGILSNFPVWLFDQEEDPQVPTFGFKLVGENPPITGPISFSKEIIYTMLEAHDEEHLEDLESVKIIPISSKGISPLAFNLSKEEKQKLFESGREAARGLWNKVGS